MDSESISIALSDAVLFCVNPKFRTVAVSEPKKYLFPFFFRDASKLVKHLRPKDIEPCNKVGIRAQLVDWNTKEMVMDFLVHQDGNAIHILNPVSPAFTCSMEMAKRLVQDYF